MVAYWSLSLMRSVCCERVEVAEVVFFKKLGLAEVLNAQKKTDQVLLDLNSVNLLTVQKVAAL